MKEKVDEMMVEKKVDFKRSSFLMKKISVVAVIRDQSDVCLERTDTA